MTRRHGEISEGPTEWFRLLWEHQAQLGSVQVLWRRGNHPYRPIVPEDMELEQIRDAEWEVHERSDTHILWQLGEVEDPEERHQAIRELVNNLWAIACRWTDLRGTWCDYRLIGRDSGDQELFCCGRRCRQSEITAQDAPESPNTSAPSWHEYTRHLENVIGHARSDRDEATKRANKTLADTHLMWSQLSDAMRDAAQFQREQVEAANNMRSGAVELRARAFQNLQETQRVQAIVGGVKDTVDALLGNLVPLADRIAAQFGGDRVVATETFPKFENSQQALRYLALTLSNTQLDLLFNKDRDAGEGFRATLLKAGNMDTEFEALALVQRLIVVLRSDRFRELADPQQQMSGRYIIGRIALYKIATDDAQGTQAQA